ncbi:MAG: hypothetical protein GY800_02690 [Planctomycetes bacterium]|nr:hypothetical protein [Planctomycetota bacterium]
MVKNYLLLRLSGVFLILCCQGCFFGFGGNKKKDSAPVYPVTKMTPPREEPEEEPVKKPVKKPARQGPPQTAFRLEMNRRFNDLSRETRDGQEDLLTRITALEEDNIQIREALSLLEFFQDEASGEVIKMQEKLEFELEALRQRIEDYNTLLVKVLNRVSTVPEATPVSEEKSPLKLPR